MRTPHHALFLAVFLAAACSDSSTTPQPTSLDPGDRFQEVYPAPVTDLSARALSHRAVELSWTEVQDGMGAPAQYQIRMLEGAAGWEQGSVVREGACGYPVRGTAIGAPVTCVVTGLEAQHGYRFMVGPERPDLTGTVRGTPSTAAHTTTRDEPIVAVPAYAEIVSGLNHTGTVGQAIQTQVEVLLKDSVGLPLPGVHVVWASGQGGGTTAGPVSVSDESGMARTVWTLGPQAGPQSLGVRVEGHDEMLVLADAEAGPVEQLRFSVDTVTLAVGAEQRLVVQGWDEYGNPVEDLPLEWQTSDRRVADVSGLGLVRTEGRGWVRIRAWIKDKWRKRKTQDSTTVVVEGDPVRVTDLSVGSAGESWLTLSWTEVDDGTGEPARYETRLGVSGASWDQAQPVTSGTCASPLNGSAVGAHRSCTVDGLADGTTFSVHVRAFREKGAERIYAASTSAEGTTLEKPTVPAGVAPESGANQAGVVGTPLPAPVVVRVLDAEGVPVAGANVSFVPSDGGSVSATSMTTDGEGRAQVSWTLGSRVGSQSLMTTVDDPAPGPGPMAMYSVAPVSIPATANAGPATTLSVTPASLTLDPGGTATFTLQAFDAFGNPTSSAGVVWTSSDPSVASVSGSGGVAAVSAGQATVQAVVEGATVSAPVTVQAPDAPPPSTDPGTIDDVRVVSTGETSMTVEFTQVDDGTGGPALTQIRYALSPMGWGWGSATVLADGACASPMTGGTVGSTRRCEIDGLLPGTSYDVQMVAWRIENGSNVYSELSTIATGATTTVATPTTPTVDRVVTSPSSVTLDQGQTYPLVAVAYDAADNVLSSPITWSSSNASVASVSEGGTVTAHAAGTALLIASALCCSEADTTLVTVRAGQNPPPPPPASGSAWYEQNWNFSSVQEMLADPQLSDASNGGGSLSMLNNVTGAPGGFTNAVRIQFKANWGREPQVGVDVSFPDAARDQPREVWVEFHARWSTDWVTNGPYAGNPDHKFFFLFDQQPSGTRRWESHVGHFGDGIGTFIAGAGHTQPFAPNIQALWDGQWHRFRYHAKMDSNGVWELEIDGQKFTWPGGNADWGAQYYFNSLALSRNLNRGTDHDMTLDFGPLKVYTADPGW